MALPDIAAVADALRGRPHEFFMEAGRLRQKNSTVGFVIHPAGLITVETGADGDRHLLSEQDARRVLAAFGDWQRDYWIAVRVNTMFARELRRAGFWRRVWHCIGQHLPERQGESALALYARAFAGDNFTALGSSGDPSPRHRPPPRPPKPCGSAPESHRVPHSLE